MDELPNTGDTPLISALREWAALPHDQRVDLERQELEKAQAAVGKFLLFEQSIHGRPLGLDFDDRHPEVAPLVDRIAAAGGGDDVIALGPDPGGSCTDCAFTMSASRMKKQDTSYYCGPASLQALVWNDPKAAQYQSQSYWAGKLGTTSSNGTWVYALKDDINGFTHWDDSDYASTYIVVDISSWSTSNYRSLFRTHLKTLRAPVQLHPRLRSGVTTTYYPGNTSGHFNVARGFEYDSGLDKVYLYEPAGGAAQGNIYPAVTATEDTDYIRLAQLDNSSQKNIVY